MEYTMNAGKEGKGKRERTEAYVRFESFIYDDRTKKR
jgi:hypothetical protein